MIGVILEGAASHLKSRYGTPTQSTNVSNINIYNFSLECVLIEKFCTVFDQCLENGKHSKLNWL